MRASPHAPNQQQAAHTAQGETVAAYPHQRDHVAARDFRLLTH